eukprot:SAG11_NODE_22035_length_413_cov_1.143312_1_plen_84_part_00
MSYCPENLHGRMRSLNGFDGAVQVSSPNTARMENVLFPLEIYNDAAERALCVLRKQARRRPVCDCAVFYRAMIHCPEILHGPM